MPNNHNPWVRQLPEWHGTGKGGVRSPYRGGGQPTGETIRTPVIVRLDELARDLAAGRPSPRWVYLVGGPGNGKSEAVEAFIGFLDGYLQASNAVVTVARTKFTAASGIPRKVEIDGSEIEGSAAEAFVRRVGRLVIVQDASSLETDGTAGQALLDDLVDLERGSGRVPATYICCVNRGILADACRRAYGLGPNNPAFRVLKTIVEATAFRIGTAQGSRPPCWPTSNSRLACWPLDVTSLFEEFEGVRAPGETLIAAATDEARWEFAGGCSDCDSRDYCPFRANATSLRDADSRKAFVALVRRGELASSERFNFRSALSLVAESIVGDWPDFSGLRDPCEWVHELVEQVTRDPPSRIDAIRSSLRLMERLTPHAVFPERGPTALEEEVHRSAVESRCLVTGWSLTASPNASFSGNTTLRHATLPRVLSPLDPAWYSPLSRDDELRVVEDDYGQGVAEGNSAFAPRLTKIEQSFLSWLAIAEQEWVGTSPVESRRAHQAQRYLRGWAASIVKRSLAIKKGEHNFGTFLAEYESGLRDRQRLLIHIRNPLERVLGTPLFRFGVMESFGRPPLTEGDALVLLTNKPGLSLRPAPPATAQAPAHDFPGPVRRELRHSLDVRRVPRSTTSGRRLHEQQPPPDREGCSGQGETEEGWSCLP